MAVKDPTKDVCKNGHVGQYVERTRKGQLFPCYRCRQCGIEAQRRKRKATPPKEPKDRLAVLKIPCELVLPYVQEHLVRIDGRLATEVNSPARTSFYERLFKTADAGAKAYWILRNNKNVTFDTADKWLTGTGNQTAWYTDPGLAALYTPAEELELEVAA